MLDFYINSRKKADDGSYIKYLSQGVLFSSMNLELPT